MSTHQLCRGAPVRAIDNRRHLWIAQDAGPEGSIVTAKIKESNETHWGFTAQSEEYQDLVRAGVIDPTKVVRTALTNAASIASLVLTTEALVSESPKGKAKRRPQLAAWPTTAPHVSEAPVIHR